MSMEDWGWIVTNYNVFPVSTDFPPAPESPVNQMQLFGLTAEV